MYVHLSIHRPKPGAEPALIESMHRFGAALEGAPGLISVRTLQDENAGVLAGLAIWSSEEAMEASVHLGREAVANDPFDEWESRETEGYRLTEV